ncbi:F-box/kelch-repeat protein At3g23880-like [Quercus robur]|uniref:F-box/kelch-repeat protein At3g23880-like n=1 Tax=Quercus robur TaxID=38942 RepID=UPI002163CA84|nr:F-box/kelch-repeat protein At3g23880-like [Quercus robur]
MSSSMLNNLPEDVLMDIFARLPVKSLLQFKCVCKSWCNLIKEPIFITKHVNQSALSNNGYLAVTRQGSTFGGNCSISLISYETFREVIRITIPSKEYGKAPFRIVGSCNGILCLNVSEIGDTNFLFNPATSEFKELPKPNYPIHELKEDTISDFIGLGFGYEPESNDYKLVRISYSKRLENQFYSGVDVYSLSTNSWRRKNRLVLGTVLVNSFSKAFINGALHWRGVTLKRGDVRCHIISFDVGSEVTRYIKLPYKIDLAKEEWWPFVRNGSLAMVIRSKTHEEHHYIFNIWVMNEYGVKKSWTKQLTVGPLFVLKLVECGMNEELLFATHSTMYLYDLQRIKPPHDDILEADIIGNNFVPWVEVVNHIESLVTIEGTKVYAKRVRKYSWFGKYFIFFQLLFGLVVMVAYVVILPKLIHFFYPTNVSE